MVMGMFFSRSNMTSDLSSSSQTSGFPRESPFKNYSFQQKSERDLLQELVDGMHELVERQRPPPPPPFPASVSVEGFNLEQEVARSKLASQLVRSIFFSVKFTANHDITVAEKDSLLTTLASQLHFPPETKITPTTTHFMITGNIGLLFEPLQSVFTYMVEVKPLQYTSATPEDVLTAFKAVLETFRNIGTFDDTVNITLQRGASLIDEYHRVPLHDFT